jgi:hypothetical protein
LENWTLIRTSWLITFPFGKFSSPNIEQINFRVISNKLFEYFGFQIRGGFTTLENFRQVYTDCNFTPILDITEQFMTIMAFNVQNFCRKWHNLLSNLYESFSDGSKEFRDFFLYYNKQKLLLRK